MEQLTGAYLFWFVTQGLVVGYIFHSVFGKEGTNLRNNLIFGIASSLLIGSFALILGIGGELLYSFLGIVAVLFIANVFHLHHVEDIVGHVDFGITIKDKRE